MAENHWKLVPKLKPKHVADHKRFVAEREALRADKTSVSVGARFKALLTGRPASWHKGKIELLGRQIAACFAHPGADLKPPRIGIDKKATKWYRAHLAEDPDVWPLPPDGMVEELKGRPVWHLTKHRVLHDLGTDWPSGGFPIPVGAGISLELMHSAARNLSPKEAVEVSAQFEDAVLAYLRGRHESLAEAPPPALVKFAIDGKAPGDATVTLTETEQNQALAAFSAASWLRFWGQNGYAFEHGSTGG